MNASSPPKSYKLDVLVRHGSGVYVGQCLQFDIAVQAPTMAQLKERFSHAFAAHCVNGLDAVPQAPRKFWDMYLRGTAEPNDWPIYVPAEAAGDGSRARAKFATIEESAA